MNHHRLALLLAPWLWTALPAQEPTAPELQDAAPLSHPRAPGALRGMTVCLATEAEDPWRVATRATHYLARLLESAGARVAVVPPPASDRSHIEDPASLATDAGACLLLELGWRPGRAAAVGVPARDGASPQQEAEGALASRLADGLAAPELTRVSRAAPGVPRLRVELTGSDDARAHRAPTHAMFAAILDWWRDDQDAIRAARPAARPRDAAAGRPVNPLWPLDRPPETDAEVAAFLKSWRNAGVVDATQVHLDVTVKRTANGWELSGATELPLLERAVRRALEGVGVEPLHGSLRLLPDAARLGCPAFGIVRTPSAQTWRRPGRATGLSGLDPSGQFEETDLLQGEPVRLLDRDGDHLLVHALSGYLGWARATAIEPCDEGRFRERLAEVAGRSDDSGGAGESAARVAVSRLGTPYLFGGRSRDGIDCSGLVGTSWASQGVYVPRDARQQILAGQLVATARQLAPLQPGDLLFFASGSGRISHVAMSIGGFRFVHATPPEVTVGSLDPEDPYYDRVAERFVLGKRVAR